MRIVGESNSPTAIRLCRNDAIPNGPTRGFSQLRREDGYSIAGPCQGKSLKPIELRVEEGEVYWFTPPGYS